MSPRIRRLGLSAIVTTLCLGLSIGAAVSAILSSTVMARAAGVEDVLNPSTWTDWTERLGFPVAVIFVVLLLIVSAVRAVWAFSKPLIEKLVYSGLNLIEVQTSFVSKIDERQDEQDVLAVEKHNVLNSLVGHYQITKDKLEDMHKDIKIIKRQNTGGHHD